MAIQKLHVPGMDRAQETEIERRLRAVEGVLYASANHEAECAEVEFEDDVVTTDSLRNILAEMGFQTRLAG